MTPSSLGLIGSNTMKAADIIEALERFFLDIIGTVLPGATLLFGIGLVANMPENIGRFSILAPKDNGDWVMLIAVSYILGQAVTSIGHSVLLSGIENLASRLRKKTFKGFGLKKLVPNFIVPEGELFEKIMADPVFKAVTSRLVKLMPELETTKDRIKVTSWRNIAMSITPEQRHTVYRFMFLSQLNLGIATVLCLLLLAWPCISLLSMVGAFPDARSVNFWLLGILLISLWPFIERRYRFYAPAMQVPFSMALAEMHKPSQKSSKPLDDSESLPSRGRPEIVYLAGGFKSGWQDKVKLKVPQFKYLDPRVHGLDKRIEYTIWDLEAVRRCDWVFAYLESSNPGGFALALEVGYAKALGKRVILVDEKSFHDPQAAPYLVMVATASDVVFNDLEDGTRFLQTFAPLV